MKNAGAARMWLHNQESKATAGAKLGGEIDWQNVLRFEVTNISSPTTSMVVKIEAITQHPDDTTRVASQLVALVGSMRDATIIYGYLDEHRLKVQEDY